MKTCWVAVWGCTVLLLSALRLEANVIGFDERFALAEDRADVLEALIPGTEDFFYYHALHYQQQGDFASAQAMIDAGVRANLRTARIQELEHRQVLLTYHDNPDRTITHLIRHLRPNLSHQRRQLTREVHLPVVLDPSRIDSERLMRTELERESRNVGGFTSASYDWLVEQSLTPAQRRDLLRRLDRPDYAGIVQLIAQDLQHERSGGFGSHAVHGLLLIDQLEELLEIMPALIRETPFIHAYLAKLRPAEGSNWEQDDAATLAYLERLAAFTDRLPPSQNSLKANVLYHRLVFERKQGRYDRDLFLAYIRLPRPVSYVSPHYRQQDAFRLHPVNLAADFQTVTLLPPIGSDESLVRAHLLHFLQSEDRDAFADYIESEYLKRIFAETRMINGIGDQESLFALLRPEEVQRLRDRIDIELLPTNPTVIAPDASVSLDVALKNVESLLIKVFEIHAAAYYRQHLSDLSADIDLDGLVPNYQRTVTYDLPPMRRHIARFDFPELKEPGVYVVELIGNGVSSRALIEKGSLRYSERVSAAGHVFRVYDHAGNWLQDATLWTVGREYTADEDGEIVVPFASQARKQKMILQHGNLATLAQWTQQAEAYQLDATIHVEREMLIAGEMCRILVRPRLTVSGATADIGLLEDVKLTIRSTDLDGSSAEREVTDFVLHNDRESIHAFRVPHRLRELTVTLSGTVENLQSGTRDSYARAVTIPVNGIDATEHIENLFLRRTSEGYFVEVRGRNGEVLDDRPLRLTIDNRYMTRDINLSLKTDAYGRAALGALQDVVSVEVRATEDAGTATWKMEDHHVLLQDRYDLAVGETLSLPWTRGELPVQQAVSLLEMRGRMPARNMIDHVTIADGYLTIQGLDAGDYLLTDRESGAGITLRVGLPAGAAGDMPPRRMNRPSLQIGAFAADEDAVSFQVLGATSDTRVHAIATRYVHPASIDLLQPFLLSHPSIWRAGMPESIYLSGRSLGDEFRYVMERKSGRIFPGNMLTRPSLILNPWRLRDTTTDDERVAAGETWEQMRRQHAGRAERERALRVAESRAEPGVAFPTLDFLASTSVLVDHLEPDANGVVTVQREALGAGQQLYLYAVNGHSGVFRTFALEEQLEEPRERRLMRYLRPALHYTERQEISLLRAGDTLQVDDILSAELEVYDSLDRVYSLFAALNGLPLLGEFSFLLRWPELEEAEKRERYSRYASHELNVFLYFKDRPFFDAVILPYLVNKKDRTFVDNWLLDEAGEDYADLWSHARLNMAERVLLGKALPERRAATAQHVKDRFDLLPPDIEGFNARFRTALRSRGLDDQEAIAGLGQAREAVTARERQRVAREIPMPEAAEIAFDAVAPAKSPVVMDGMLGARGAAQQPEAPPAPSGDFLALEGGALLDSDEDMDTEVLSRTLGVDARRRTEIRQLYRQLGRTGEWVENHYYHLPIEQQLASLIEVNAFWVDLAAHAEEEGFLSRHVASASRNFAEMMLALAVLDIPFQAAEHDTVFEGGGMTLTAGSDMIVFHKQVRPAERVAEQPTLLVAQNFFARNDRYRYENNERFDKFVTEAFEAGRVYGCQIVLTNPTSTRRKIDLLTQIPAGSIPVLGGIQTRTRHLELAPFSTQTQEYYFYFPLPGTYAHYPVHAAEEGKVIGYSAPFVFEVVAEVTDIDETSWEHISQFATDEQVLDYLTRHNVDRLNLALIAFRMRDKEFFRAATDLLRERFVYDHTLWAYSLHHNDTTTLREYLPHTPVATQSGRVIDSPVLTLDPVERHLYQHKEYWPLVNPRVFRLGRERQILNREFHGQYMSFLENLRYRSALTPDDRMTLVTYLLLQDRVEEALGFFAQIDRAQIDGKLQYDYMAAYLAFSRGVPEEARAIAEAYRDHPVKRWRDLFGDVLAQADEIAGTGGIVVLDRESHTQTQTQLADTEPWLSTEIEGRQLRLEYRNLDRVTVNIYPMDLELLFSRQPFVQDVGEQFAMIRPNATYVHALDADEETVLLDIPAAFRDRNVMIEVVAAGIRSRTTYYPNSLRVDLIENYGQLRVRARDDRRALPKVYVKVYARMADGSIQFFKDGYTDLRGRFDYASLNTDTMGQVDRFAILVLSENHGAVVREVGPPPM